MLTMFAGACDNTPTDPGGGGVVTVTGVAVTLSSNPAALLVTVQADAAVQPSNAPQSVTWSTSDSDIATVDATGLIELHLRGEVTITATSTADSNRSGSVTLTVVCPDPRLLTQPQFEDQTWENWIPDPGCYDYVAQRDLGSNDYELVIEPGTVVGFEEGFGLQIKSRAALIAEGTEEDPMILTGTTKERGFWKGVAFVGNNDGRTVLNWITVEYTGGHNLSGAKNSSLIMLGDAFARIQNSTFRESAGYGVSLDIQSRITDPEGNAFTDNALGPAWALATAVPSLNGATLTGNDVDEVVVQPLTIGEANWPAATYRILEAGSLYANDGLLTLAPGSELRFEQGQSLTIGNQGGLYAVGTASEPIVLTGTEPVRGHWDGLSFWGSRHQMNRLEHVTVEYGGGERFGSASEAANVNLTIAGSGQHSNVSIVNSVLRHSAEYGLWVRLNSGLTEFTGNTLTGNALGPAYVTLPSADQLLPGNDYTGNDTDEVVVEVGSGLQLTEPTTWPDLGVPYYLQEKVGITGVQAPWMIMPGVEILVESSLGILVSGEGSVTAVGTPQEMIKISGKDGGIWQGFHFSGTNGDFGYIELEDGGGVEWGGSVSAPAVVTIQTATGGAFVLFGTGTSITGPNYAIAFGTGNATARGCVGLVWVPVGETVLDHCF